MGLMEGNVSSAFHVDQPSKQCPTAGSIVLTLVDPQSGSALNRVKANTSELLAYTQQFGHTRLVLKGGRIWNVRETTGTIDLLVRDAAA